MAWHGAYAILKASINASAEELHDCIYCRRTLPAQTFTREHVLSRAFGTFADAPVLRGS